MPHYKDGTEANVGDYVVGYGYNVKNIISGYVAHIVKSANACNIQVMHTTIHRIYDIDGQTTHCLPIQAIEYGETSSFEKVG